MYDTAMTSFKMQIKGGSKVLKPALDAFGGGTDDDADAAGAASASGRGYGAGTSSAAGGAPPQPGANGNAQDLKSRGVAAAKAGDYAGALHLFAQVRGSEGRVHLTGHPVATPTPRRALQPTGRNAALLL